MGIILLAAAGCAPDKPKLDLQTSATTFDAAEASGGRWTEVQVVESAHPYENDASMTYMIRGSDDAAELRLVFERFDLEAGYDFLEITGTEEILHRWTGARSGQELVMSGNTATLRLSTDYSVRKWGFAVRVYERAACICTQEVMPVCGADGETYSNECKAGCQGVRVAYEGPCQEDAWVDVPRRIESAHPYANDFTQTWRIQEVGARSLRVHFASLDLERGYDFVRILDGEDRVVATYTGRQEGFHSAVVEGEVLQVELRTDHSVTRPGFVIDAYQATGGCHSDRECGANMVCNQPQCVRAPCFAMCEPAPSAGYVNVSVEEIAADPEAFDGRQVRVLGAPEVRAFCTRRACPESEPCCNRCSGSFTVGGALTLRDSEDQPYGCMGNECTFRSTCREFAPENAGPYRFEGTVRRDQGGGLSLLVDAFEAADCQVAGCSGQACANTPNVITTCDFRPEYACYRRSTCEAQATGHCGWTQTPALLQCLAGANAEEVAATDVPLGIPDDDAEGVQSEIGVISSGQVSELLVSLEIEHTYRGDLVVTLTSPSGTQVVLHDGEGGSADDLVVLDRAVPELSGERRNGRWRLHVRDRYARDVGQLLGWSLTFR